LWILGAQRSPSSSNNERFPGLDEANDVQLNIRNQTAFEVPKPVFFAAGLYANNCLSIVTPEDLGGFDDGRVIRIAYSLIAVPVEGTAYGLPPRHRKAGNLMTGDGNLRTRINAKLRDLGVKFTIEDATEENDQAGGSWAGFFAGVADPDERGILSMAYDGISPDPHPPPPIRPGSPAAGTCQRLADFSHSETPNSGNLPV
jgi:hypothetical protein